MSIHRKMTFEIKNMKLQEADSESTSKVVEDEESGTQLAMSKKLKLVTSAVLWFCYFSLGMNDFIFGLTFDDLSDVLQVSFAQISYFAVYRQFAYTLGSLAGVAFNYVNRQMALTLMVLLAGATLFVTPYSPSLAIFYLLAILNGFAGGAVDVGFHVWLLEMFQNGGGPLLQALHFSYGVGIAIAPLIVSNFLIGESSCGVIEKDSQYENSTQVSLVARDADFIAMVQKSLFYPYAIIGSIFTFGGLLLGALYFYKPYVPPKELQLPQSFDEQMPIQMSYKEKLELWKKSVPSLYIILIISIGSAMLFAYLGLEVTYYQFLAQFTTAVPLPIQGGVAAYLVSAAGTAYAIGGFLAMLASFRIKPEKMVYPNFVLLNVGAAILWAEYKASLPWFWFGNIVMGFGFSSCYATMYTFLEHQINVTNMIGSIFLFAGGLGTALFPLLLAAICEMPQYLIFLSLFATNISLLLFVVMHFLTKIRGKQVKLMKNQLLLRKRSAALTMFKERTQSGMSNVSS